MGSSVKEFYNKHILPLQNEAASNSDLQLDVKIDADAESYFTEPLHPDYLYLNNISFERNELEKQLSQLWKDQPALTKAIPDLLNMAFELKEENKEQTAELSPFVYVMF